MIQLSCSNRPELMTKTRESLEKPITPGWSRLVRERREEIGMKQGELSRLLGVSQAVVSKLESGNLQSSSLVNEICRILTIPPPSFPIDVDDERWLDAGKELKARDVGLFRSLMALAGEAVRALDRKEAA